MNLGTTGSTSWHDQPGSECNLAFLTHPHHTTISIVLAQSGAFAIDLFPFPIW